VDVIQKFSTPEFAYVVRIERAKAKVALDEVLRRRRMLRVAMPREAKRSPRWPYG
jgi:hypothetical protein